MSYPDQNLDPAYSGGPGYPTSGGAVGAPPSTVQWAFGLMMLRALFSLIGLVLVFALKGNLRDRLAADATRNGQDLDALVNTAVTVGVVIGVIFLVLYVLLAFQVRAGKQWARVVTFIVAALGVLSIFSAFTGDQTTAARIVSVVSAVVDLAIIVALAMRPTSDYIAARRQRV